VSLKQLFAGLSILYQTIKAIASSVTRQNTASGSKSVLDGGVVTRGVAIVWYKGLGVLGMVGMRYAFAGFVGIDGGGVEELKVSQAV
jgi:hypothetical protein